MRFEVLDSVDMNFGTTQNTLPEFGSLTSTKYFAECFFRALDKEALCRVPRKKPWVKENTRRKSSLPSVLFWTLGKEFLCQVFYFDTRQRALCRVIFSTLDKDNLKITF
jgi:hypothetical protein